MRFGFMLHPALSKASSPPIHLTYPNGINTPGCCLCFLIPKLVHMELEALKTKYITPINLVISLSVKYADTSERTFASGLIVHRMLQRYTNGEGFLTGRGKEAVIAVYYIKS